MNTKASTTETDDPRPDLFQDSVLWKALLPRARQLHGDYLASLLRVMRSCRARIRHRKDGSLYVEGEVDTGGPGWQSVEEWKADRDELLKPHSAEILALLRELGSVTQ